MKKENIEYIVKVKKLEELFEILVEIIERNKGQKITSWDKGYLNHLSIKFCFHLSSILKLLPESKLYMPILNAKLFDFSSICVLSRSMIETFIKLLYILKENSDPHLQNLKFLVFEYHSEKKRLNLLKLNNYRMNKAIKELEDQVKELWEKIKENPRFNKFEKRSKETIKGRRAFLFSDEEICNNYNISNEYYNMIFQYLSQYIHPLPFGTKQMTQLSESIDDIYILINPCLDHCINFTHLMIHYYLLSLDNTKFQLSDEMISETELSLYISKKFSEHIFDH